MSVATQQIGKSNTARKANKNASKIIFVLFITLFLLVGIGIGTYTYYILSYEGFYPGVYIDDISLEGMSPSQAVKALQKNTSQHLIL